ncbi:hypothetical protein MRX96_055879 [Rhipicephalus microplus]
MEKVESPVLLSRASRHVGRATRWRLPCRHAMEEAAMQSALQLGRAVMVGAGRRRLPALSCMHGGGALRSLWRALELWPTFSRKGRALPKCAISMVSRTRKIRDTVLIGGPAAFQGFGE